MMKKVSSLDTAQAERPNKIRNTNVTLSFQHSIEQGLPQQPHIMMSPLNSKDLGDFQKDLIQYCIDSEGYNNLLTLRRVNWFYCLEIDKQFIEYIKKQFSIERLDSIGFEILADCLTPKAQFALLLYFCAKRYLKRPKDDLYKKSCETYQNIFESHLETFKSMIISTPGDFFCSEEGRCFSLTIYPSLSTTAEIYNTSAVSTYLLTCYLKQCIKNDEFMREVGPCQMKAIANFLKRYESLDSISDIIDNFHHKFYTSLISSRSIQGKWIAMMGFLTFMKLDLINIDLVKEFQLVQKVGSIIASKIEQNFPEDERLKKVALRFLTKLVENDLLDPLLVGECRLMQNADLLRTHTGLKIEHHAKVLCHRLCEFMKDRHRFVRS